MYQKTCQKEAAIKYVEQLKDSGTEKGGAFILWREDEDECE